RPDLAVDADLADAACDELRVLRAEIEDEDFVAVDVGHWQRDQGMGKKLGSASPSSRRRPGSSENPREALKIDDVCFARVPDRIPAFAGMTSEKAPVWITN
ncbi:MAG: hypothetical protein ACTHNE_07635, partial [Dyella sp.]|uniref:hypothetical protein n=1 Tax=Dyella sp. TaxID=1869338 RepID=UPI003F823618